MRLEPTTPLHGMTPRAPPVLLVIVVMRIGSELSVSILGMVRQAILDGYIVGIVVFEYPKMGCRFSMSMAVPSPVIPLSTPGYMDDILFFFILYN